MDEAFKYSIIIPVYNRPEEIDELLDSLTKQTFKDFEVLIIEDGSTTTCEKVYERYTQQLKIRYFFKPNSGPGPSRNYGYQQAKGEYFIVFDSDCIVPPHYLESVEKFIQKTPLDAWGGPDKGHDEFTVLQRAMAFTMSSVLTTGGIRGGAKQVDGFQPRSFNMGIHYSVFEKTGGFKFDRFAEDIEFSIRMRKGGFKVGYIPDAFVYHKRRTTLKQFFWQVYNFGRGRVLVGRVHSNAIKITHMLPAIFMLGIIIGLITLAFNAVVSCVILLCYCAYFLSIAIVGFKVTHSLSVAMASIPSAFVQLTGYGYGFVKEMLMPSR